VPCGAGERHTGTIRQRRTLLAALARTLSRMAAMKGVRMAALSVRYLGRMLRAVADRLDPEGTAEVLRLESDGPAVIFRLDGHPYAAMLEEQVPHG
jgi:hypothetical protein